MDPQNQNSNMSSSSEVPTPTLQSKNTLMAVLSYLGILVIIPLVAGGKNDQFVKFHAKQGLVLFICEVVIWTAFSFLWYFWMLLNLINLGIFVLAIFGIINAVKGEMKELPLVGQFAKHLNF